MEVDGSSDGVDDISKHTNEVATPKHITVSKRSKASLSPVQAAVEANALQGRLDKR